MLKLAELGEQLRTGPVYQTSGRVVAVKGATVLARVPMVSIGSLCSIERAGREPCLAEAISFEDDLVYLAPFDHLDGISPGAKVEGGSAALKLNLVHARPGNVLDALGQPLSLLNSEANGPQMPFSTHQSPPAALSREMISSALPTGVRVIDGLCTIGYGQRIGLFSSAGVGKSTLLGMIARNAEVDLSVIALVGERGREVREFVETCLGEEGRRKAIVVVSTSDEAPLRRKLAALTATAIAEHYRERGKRVLLLVDSLTRMARAIRDVSLSAGEIPVRHGYTPSVYLELPRLLERAGTSDKGSITAIYTVLTNELGDSDPLAEEVKSILDGHVVLNPELAERGIRPAIDPLKSISRLFSELHSAEERKNARLIVKMLSRLRKDKDILLFGGTPDKELEVFLSLEPKLIKLLCQNKDDRSVFENTTRDVHALAAEIRTLLH